jgi:protein-L-isoaspartate(D-aspartate) O-methyltransferase
VDRAHFCPNPRYAYEDSPQSIGHDATISAPHMHASACESLLSFLKPGSRVLDIGSGSGYLTAVLAELVCPEGEVIGLEHIPALRDLGFNNMSKSSRGEELINGGKVSFVVGDGRLGWTGNSGADSELYDAIHVGAAAVKLHDPLVKQLKRPGRMFIPVENPSNGLQHIWVVDKDKDGRVEEKQMYGVRYVPLTDAPK